MINLNFLVVSLSVVGSLYAEETRPLLKAVSAPLPQRSSLQPLVRTASVALGVHGAVLANAPLAPAPSVVSLNEHHELPESVVSERSRTDDKQDTSGSRS